MRVVFLPYPTKQNIYNLTRNQILDKRLCLINVIFKKKFKIKLLYLLLNPSLASFVVMPGFASTYFAEATI